MKQILTGLSLFVLMVYGLTGKTGVKVHVYVNPPATCSFAQKYCTDFYTNLSIVSNSEDLQMLEEAAGGTYPKSWINSQQISCKSVKYEDTHISSVQYLFENPPYCAFATGSGWKKISCSNTFPFFCHEYFVLVQENKTWEEALDYCRTYYTDLASFSFGWPRNQIKNETDNAQTDSVWTGLRFLNGNWYWLNVRNAQNKLSLPSCPPEPHRCGARNIEKEQWENRDCEERLNFLCLE